MHLETLRRHIPTLMVLASMAGVASGQGVMGVPGSPGWTQELLRESRQGPLLELVVQPLIESATLRRGFEVTVHQDNAPWAGILHGGRRPVRFHLPPGHLYTLEVGHPLAYRKIIQFDAQDLDRHLRLECDIDLMLRPTTDPLTFEDELILSTPLSVVWYDGKRNLFRHDAYLHDDGIERLRSHLTLRDPSLHALDSKTCTMPPENGAAGQHR